MKKIFKIDLDIFPGTFIVAVGFNTKELKRKLVKFGKFEYHDDFDIDDCEGQCSFYRIGKRNTAIIAIGKFKKNPYDISVVVHEALHAVNYILGCAGIELTRNRASDETFAYTQDYVVRKILEQLWKK